MDLEEVKVCLRALLSSNPMSYQVNSLLVDFEKTTGVSLPLFGYANPVEFLKSIDDTLKLQGDSCNSEVVLVESKKSAHIISLVNRQKIPGRTKSKNSHFATKNKRQVIPAQKTNNFGVPEGNYSSWDLFKYQRPGNGETTTSSFNPMNFQSTSRQNPGNPFKKSNVKPFFPQPETKHYGHIPFSRKAGPSFQPVYAKQSPPLVGRPFSFKRAQSPQPMKPAKSFCSRAAQPPQLMAVDPFSAKTDQPPQPGTAMPPLSITPAPPHFIKNRRVYSDSKNSASNAKTKYGFNAKTKYGFNAKTKYGFNAKTKYGFNAKTKYGFNAKTKYASNAKTNSASNSKTSFAPSQRKKPWQQASMESADTIRTENCFFEDFSDFSDDDSCMNVEISKTDPVPRASGSVGFINVSIRDKLQNLIKKHPEGLWCCELPQVFFEEYDAELDYREYGCTSLVQMLSELPDVFRCVRPGDEDWIVFDASTLPSAEEEKVLNFQQKGDMMSIVRENMQKLMAKLCENSSSMGVELDKVEDMYQEMFGMPLQFRSLGFKDVKSLLEIWDGNFLNLINIGGKVFCNPAFNSTTPSSLPWKDAVPPITADSDIFREIFPKEVVGPDENFLEMDLSDHIEIGEVVEVCVAEVWSPTKFFVQFKKFKNHLSQYMDDLQKFYNANMNRYRMPESTLRPNQLCVGLYNSDPEFPDEWHRARIIKVLNEKSVLLNFVDYGTGFQARLSGVLPLDDETTWPMTTSRKFLEMMQVPYMIAELIDINFKKGALSVILFDPFQKPKLNINEKMIQDKLAKPGEPFYFKDKVPKTTPPESETKEPTECSSSALAQAIESLSISVPELTDEFSDVDDLSPLTFFQLKMRNLNSLPAAEKKTECLNANYEFEEIPELRGENTDREIEEEAKQQNSEADLEVAGAFLKSLVPEPRKKKPKSSTPLKASEEDPKPILFQVDTSRKRICSEPGEVDTSPVKETTPEKAKRLPPGLERVSTPSDFTEIPFLMQSQDLKAKINVLAMELLTKNASIKQVGVSNPALALQIATEMAKAYLSSGVPLDSPTSCNPFPFLPQSLAKDVAALAPPPRDRKEGGLDAWLSPGAVFPGPSSPTESPGTTAGTLPSTGDAPAYSFRKGRAHQSTAAESDEYIEEAQIGGKTLHLVTIDDELYLSSEEIIRQFTTFANREIAERILNTKKVKIDYRVVSKRSDKKVLYAMKSIDLGRVAKRKTKKLKIYLLPLAKVVPFLQGLGCQTKSVESDILEFQKNWEEKITQKAEVFSD